MITINSALSLIKNSASNTKKRELVILPDADGRFLANSVCADRDLPPFNRVAVDGYACKKNDLGLPLEILEVIPAGKNPTFSINEGKCSKVMTGCALPEGAETVFMVEDSEILESGLVKFTGNSNSVRHGNFSLKGEEISAGTELFKVGKQINSTDIGTLALVGAYNLTVRPKLKIGVIATGDELVEPYNTPETVQIRNANSYQLISQIKGCGQEGIYYGIVKDEPKLISELFKKAVTECDIVILTGGVSAGDFDFVPQIITENGFQILFDQVAIKPGKPTTFAIKEEKYVIGLPGNPVSGFVIFELFVKPLIFQIMGSEFEPLTISMELGVGFKRRNSERTEYVPIDIENGLAKPLKYHGSGHLQILTIAKGWMEVLSGVSELGQGEKVKVVIF